MEGGRKEAFSPERRLPDRRSSYLDILWLQGLQPCPLTFCVPISPHSSLDTSDMSPHFQVRLVRFVCALELFCSYSLLMTTDLRKEPGVF